MATISLTEVMAKETNNFTDPEFVKAYNEAMERYEKEIQEYHKSKEYKKRVAKREAEANKTLREAKAEAEAKANKALREAIAIAIAQAEANKTLEKTPKTA